MTDNLAPACFVDSNIWIYAFVEGNSPLKQRRACEITQLCQPVISSQVVNEVCVNLLRRARFSEAECLEVIETLFDECRVIESGASMYSQAMKLYGRYSLSFWDALILAAALEAEVGVIYTEDMQHGLRVYDRLEIQNPFMDSDLAS